MGLFNSIAERVEADYLQSKQGGLTGLAGLLKLIGGVGMMIVGAVFGAPAFGIGAILGGMAGYFLGRYILFVLIPLAILALTLRGGFFLELTGFRRGPPLLFPRQNYAQAPQDLHATLKETAASF